MYVSLKCENLNNQTLKFELREENETGDRL